MYLSSRPIDEEICLISYRHLTEHHKEEHMPLSHKLMLRDTDFMSMMQRRIFNVLLVANPYDAFMLEDDGRIDEKLFEEYTKLGLRYPPRFFRAASREEAVTQVAQHPFDLIICMPSTESNDVFDPGDAGFHASPPFSVS